VSEFLLFVVPMIVAFYFILLRPVLDQQRRRKRDISALNLGDEVVTTGGFYAVVREIRTQERGPLELILEVAPGVQLRATADAVAYVSAHAAALAGEPRTP
jgi:preprotein translocase YajC subunit